MSSRRQWAAAVSLICALTLLAGCSDSETPVSATSPGTGDSATRDPSRGPANSGLPSPSGSAGPTGKPRKDPQGREGSPGGAEMPSISASASGLPGLQSTVPGDPIAERPWPRAAATDASVVPGFPESLRPVRDSSLTSTSVSPAGDTMQVALVATTTQSPRAVLRTYRSRMTEHALREVPAEAVGGSEAVGFRRGRTSVVVTVRPNGKRTDYTVFGVLYDSKG